MPSVLDAAVIVGLGFLWLDGRPGARYPRLDRAIVRAEDLALQVVMKAVLLGTVALLLALVIGAVV